jgi:hypothetical protein
MKNHRLTILVGCSIALILNTPAFTWAQSASSPNVSSPGVTAIATDIPWWLLLLNGLEIAGIGGLFWLMNQHKKSADAKTKTLAKELKAALEKLHEQGIKVDRANQDLVQANKRIDNIKPAPITQAYVPSNTQPYPQFDQAQAAVPSPAKPPVAKSNYNFLDEYNRHQESFAQQYFPTVVSEDADNINERRSGDSNDVILGENSRGNYWLVSENNKIYLVPKPKIKIQEHNIRTVRELFDCTTFDPDYQSFSVVEPALVSVYASASGLKWRVDRKGELKFN